MKCERCTRNFLITKAIRSQLKNGKVETWCRGCGYPITITKEMIEKDEKEREERKNICTCCGKPKENDGYQTCAECREYYRVKYNQQVEENRDSLVEIKERYSKKRVKPKESVDDIARKARSHGLSYGKYLEARARGMYLSEIDE